MKISAMSVSGCGPAQGSRPKKFMIEVGSGALRSWNGPNQGA